MKNKILLILTSLYLIFGVNNLFGATTTPVPPPTKYNTTQLETNGTGASARIQIKSGVSVTNPVFVGTLTLTGVTGSATNLLNLTANVTIDATGNMSVNGDSTLAVANLVLTNALPVEAFVTSGDPGADRVYGWDDSAGTNAFFSFTSDFSISVGNAISIASTFATDAEVAAAISDTAFASSWNGVTTIAPTKNAVYDWAHTFDTDDDGLPDKVDLASAGYVRTTAGGVISSGTTSANVASDISDETGTGVLVFSADPALTGNPTAPTASANDNDTSIATTAYVQSELTAYASDTITFTGKTIDAAGTGNILKWRQKLDFPFPFRADGAGAIISTNDASAASFAHATFSGSAATNANWVEYEWIVDDEIDTSVDLKIVYYKVRTSGTSTSATTWSIGMANIADSADGTTTTFSNFAIFNITPSSPDG